MSSNTPPGSVGDPEYLSSSSGTEAANAGGSGKKWGVLGGAAAGVVAVIGLGGWGAYSLLAGTGDQPAEAIPASAVGYMSLDLDPSASQKIEAFKVLKKFPGVEEELNLSDRDDLRRLVFDAVQDEGACKDIDYGKDIWPWIGDRVAMAAVPGDNGKIVPLVVLQVTDAEAASSGVEALAKCSEAGSKFGFTFSGDYVLITDSKKRAESFANEAEEASLADDKGFQEWTGAVGDPGIVTMYASAEAPAYYLDAQSDLMGLGGMPPSHAFRSSTDRGSSGVLPEGDPGFSGKPGFGPEFQDTMNRRDEQMMNRMNPQMNQMNDKMQEQYKDFEGMAGVVRFEDGAVEVEVAGKGVPAGLAESGDSVVSDLPASTGAAVSASVSDDLVEDYFDQMSTMFGGGGPLPDESMATLEKETGLTLPEDIETLLGDSVAVAVDSDIDFKALSKSQDPSDVPAGIKVHGNPDEIMPIVDKIKATLGPQADMLIVESSEDVVAFGFDQGYVDSLLADGRLGEDEAFRDVVPDADKAAAVFYLNFDAGDGWADQLASLVSDGDPKARKNVEPLDALGISAWVEDGVQRGLFRMTTD